MKVLDTEPSRPIVLLRRDMDALKNERITALQDAWNAVNKLLQKSMEKESAMALSHHYHLADNNNIAIKAYKKALRAIKEIKV